MNEQDPRPLLSKGVQLHQLLRGESIPLIGWLKFKVVTIVEIDASLRVSTRHFLYQRGRFEREREIEFEFELGCEERV
jgi:hypothetical protein